MNVRDRLFIKPAHGDDFSLYVRTVRVQTFQLARQNIGVFLGRVFGRRLGGMGDDGGFALRDRFPDADFHGAAARQSEQRARA